MSQRNKPKFHKRRFIKYDEYELNITHFLISLEHLFFLWLFHIHLTNSFYMVWKKRKQASFSLFIGGIFSLLFVGFDHFSAVFWTQSNPCSDIVWPSMASKIYTHQNYKHHDNSNFSPSNFLLLSYLRTLYYTHISFFVLCLQ